MALDPSFDEDRLPWLEAVEDEDGPRGISARKMVAALLVVLLAVAVVAASFFWMGRRNVEGGAPPVLIRAPATPYKVKPANPGGIDVSGESETTFATSAGQEVNGRLDTSKLGETGTVAPATAPANSSTASPSTPAQTPAPAPPAAAKPKASAPTNTDAAVASGAVIQLGAFKNTAQAERAWVALSARFPKLGDTTKIVVPYSAGGSSGYRLRAAASSPAAAKDVCQALQSGGESCFIAH